MLLAIGKGLYGVAIIFAITLIISALALVLSISRTDGFELYALAGIMTTAAVVVWLAGRAIHRFAR